MSKNTLKRYVIFSFIGEDGKNQYVLNKYFSTFGYNHVPHQEGKNCYYLQAFNTAEILKSHINDC